MRKKQSPVRHVLALTKAAGTGTTVITQLCITSNNGNESLKLKKSRIPYSHDLKNKKRNKEKKKKSQIDGKKSWFYSSRKVAETYALEDHLHQQIDP